MTILVCGGTGTTGTHVVAGLVAAGRAVRVLTRRERSAEQLSRRGVETVIGDLADPSSLAPALEGVTSAYIATSASPSLPLLEGALAQAAAAAGVRHVVKLSVIGAATDGAIAYARVHAEAEDAVRAAGVTLTAVRPNGFMQNTFRWSDQVRSGVLRVPVPDARWSIVDARDVAAVAVAALLDPHQYAGHVLTVTGPGALSARDEAGLIADALHRPLRVEEVPLADAVRAMRDAGWPDWSAGSMGELFDFYAAGASEAVSDDVQAVTGRLPRSYAAFVAEHLQVWR